jgi:hypothetical protein
MKERITEDGIVVLEEDQPIKVSAYVCSCAKRFDSLSPQTKALLLEFFRRCYRIGGPRPIPILPEQFDEILECLGKRLYDEAEIGFERLC